MGLDWINRVGVVTLVLGAAFFFKYAVESGWLGPLARVSIGCAAGLAAVALGERLWRGGQQVYGQGISAAGIGILYLTFYAASGLYRLIPEAVSFAAMALTTAGAATLALRYGAVALAALGLFGGYATPLLLAGGGDRPWFVLSYVALLNVAALYMARERGWNGIPALAAAGAVWVYGAQLGSPIPPERRAALTGFALAYWAMFSSARARAIGVAMQVLAAMVLAGIWAHALWPYMAAALVLAGAGLAVADRRGHPLASFVPFWVAYGMWHWQEQRPDALLFAFLTLAFVLFAAWLPWRVWMRRAQPRVEDLVLAAFNAGTYFAAGYVLLAYRYAAWRGLFAVLLAAAHLALAWLLHARERRGALFSAGIAWALLVLAAPAQFLGYRVTVVWALEAAALAWIGRRFDEKRSVTGALCVFALVVLRLALVDTWAYRSPAAYSAVANARFLTFLFAAACLWLAAWWTGSAKGPALAAYIGGHVVALWGLSLEVAGWAARTASPANLANVESASLSVLLAAYAVLLVVIGLFTGTLLNRALGLGLIGIVVLKLYLHDVWSLGLFYRMAAFAILGALLLAMSYLYSRFRSSVERWWRDSRAG